MLTERDIELAHPDAFDVAFGNLPEVKQAEFTRHLGRCPHCQKVLGEYSDIGRIIKLLPPHVEPPADLEDRTVAAMVTALAGVADVGEYGQDAPVVICGGQQAQLGEDRPDVGLDGVFGDRNSRWQMAWLERPSAMSARMSRSRRASWSKMLSCFRRRRSTESSASTTVTGGAAALDAGSGSGAGACSGIAR